jgi:serine/threonine protein kinase
MTQLLHCPSGHQWEADTSKRSETDLRNLRCPVCGTAVLFNDATIVGDRPESPARTIVDQGLNQHARQFARTVQDSQQIDAPDPGAAASQDATVVVPDPGTDQVEKTLDLSNAAKEKTPDFETPTLEISDMESPTPVTSQTQIVLDPDGAGNRSQNGVSATVESHELSATQVEAPCDDAQQQTLSVPDLAAGAPNEDFSATLDADKVGGVGDEPTERTVPPSGERPPRAGESKLVRDLKETRSLVGRHPPGYEVLGELGRGGMGVVFKARQKGPNRIVALKMILAGGLADTRELTRFRIEAEAVGHLAHPNIVQVYEVGEHEGLPYFSLEYVDGGSLLGKIAGTPQPARDAAKLVQALADAMDYAHRRGIMHRDLKPANILLTTDGVPKITDFGLAKRLEEDTGQTRTGAILGTPSYMAPEQAAGRTKEVGPPADIYALGSILYELLTGLPPFRGETVYDTIKMVQSAEPVPPTRLHTKVPRDLETICLKALNKEPRNRYETAGFLAEDLRRFLSNEPIRARRTRLWEHAWKWTKRRPAVAALIAVSSLALIAFSVGGYIFARQESQRAEQADYLTAIALDHERIAEDRRREAEHQRNRAIDQEKIAEERRKEADQQRTRAEKNFQQALAAVDEMLTRVGQERLAHEPRMEKVRRDLLQKALRFYEEFLGTEGDNPLVRLETARARQRVGDIQEMLGENRAAEKAYRSAVSAFVDLKDKFPDRPDLMHELANTYGALSLVLQNLGRREDAEIERQKSLDLKNMLVARFPKPEYRYELAAGLQNRALLLQTQNRLSPAEEAYGRALEIFDRLATDFPNAAAYQQELARTSANYGTLLQATRRSKAAENAYRRAVEVLEKLVARWPENESYQNELGRTYWNFGVLMQMNADVRDAEKNYRRAIDTFAKLAEKFPTVPEYRHELAGADNNLSNLLQATQRLAEAEKVREQARDLLTKLAADFPDKPNYREELARVMDQYGILLVSTDRAAQAEDAWRRAIGLQKQLVADYPKEPVYQQELARSYGNLGILLSKLNRLDKAEAQYGLAIELLEKLENASPSVAAYRDELVSYNTNLAALLTALGRRSDAEKVWQRVAAVQMKQLAASPESHQFERALGGTFVSLAKLQLESNRLAEALQYFQDAIRHQRAALSTNSKIAAYRQELLNSYYNVVDIHIQLEEHVLAAGVISELNGLMPADSPARVHAAELLARCAQLAEKDPKLTDTKRKDSARSYSDKAIELLQQAVAGGYADVDYLNKSADFNQLRSRDDFKKLLTTLEAGKPSGSK